MNVFEALNLLQVPCQPNCWKMAPSKLPHYMVPSVEEIANLHWMVSPWKMKQNHKIMEIAHFKSSNFQEASTIQHIEQTTYWHHPVNGSKYLSTAEVFIVMRRKKVILIAALTLLQRKSFFPEDTLSRRANQSITSPKWLSFYQKGSIGLGNGMVSGGTFNRLQALFPRYVYAYYFDKTVNVICSC